MALLKDGRPHADEYTDVSAGTTADVLNSTAGPVIVSLQQWQTHRDELLRRGTHLGIVLRSDEKPDALSSDLEHFAVIALDFPTFRDGRAYSSARVLRQRYGYAGELRAVGDVLLEQLHFMHRVGFNSFLLESDNVVAEWETAASDISVWYQPTGDGRPTAIQQRHAAG
ncbi:MAG: DUF934 domain-containing protein [Gammaproteobacteria bacterium]|jgi:uncharacterized protein (DUF934 family)|nr:DUF934 domain-containing protein [Gammaproteobacteria bacterium]